MKVVHIINDVNLENGGAQRIVRQLQKGLSDINVNSEIISLNPVDSSEVGIRSLNCSSVYSFSAFVRLWSAARGLDKTSVVHAHLFPTILYLALLKRLKVLKNKLIFTEHSTSNRRRNTKFGRLVDPLIYKMIDTVVAISDGTASSLKSWQPVVTGKMEVIKNGIELKKDNFQQKENNDPLRILSVGRLVEAKNYLNMIEAISLLKDANIIYNIAGEGELRAIIEERINELNLSHKVNLLGYRSDISDLMSTHEILLIASKWEGFGLSALEGMNQGMSVVASNIPGLGELVDTAGILVNPESSQQIADAVQNLIEDESLRTELGQKAFNFSQEYNIESTVLKYKNCYERSIPKNA